jgi:predicted phosphodiesterase
MKLKILSDLHLEFSYLDITQDDEDILILAGDIHTTSLLTYDYIKDYLDKYDTCKVIYILGNHDYYSSNIEDTLQFWDKVELERFYYLHNTSIVIDNIRFFGCTLWTDLNNNDEKTVNKIKHVINDFRQIESFTPLKSIQLHYESKNALINTINKSDENLVIITHHLPSYKSINPKYSNYITNGGFYTNLDDIVCNDKIKLWIHGHTHSNHDYYIGKTRVICNPRGYVTKKRIENKMFNPSFIVNLLKL